jgi:hypothetical protein
MRNQLTLQDFLSCNQKCFACFHQTELFLATVEMANNGITDNRSAIFKDHITCVLEIKYKSKLEIYIKRKSNKFIVNDMNRFLEWKKDKNIRYYSYCNNCSSSIESDNLDFNIEKGHIKPVSLRDECFYFSPLDINSDFDLFSDHYAQKSIIIYGEQKIQTHLISMLKYKNRQELINKIKRLLVFS